jgi:predicted membrane metal-binding protein
MNMALRNLIVGGIGCIALVCVLLGAPHRVVDALVVLLALAVLVLFIG